MQLSPTVALRRKRALLLGSVAPVLLLLASGAFDARALAACQDDSGAPAARLAAPGTNLDEVMAVDSRPAQAGRIPEGTSQEASDLWDKLVRSISMTGGQPGAPASSSGAPRSFELMFDGRIRSETGSNDYRARFAYLELGPGLVRATMLDGRDAPKSVQMRGLGPGDGLEYWFRKLNGAAATEWTALDRRDYRESRNETDTWVSISYDIARLTDPSSFRIVNLQVRKVREGSTRIADGILDLEGDPGIRLPDTDLAGVVGGRAQELTEFTRNLVWLELATPDFQAIGSKKRKKAEEPDVRRLVFGMDPETFRPQLVIVAPHRTDMPLQVPGTLLVQCTDWIESGPEGKPKALIPGRFLSYETEAASDAEVEVSGLRTRFSNTTSADLFLLDSSDMNADLRREDFLPPK